MAGKLIDKVAIVTGASSGIGEATALALAVEGATLVIAARRSDRLQDLEARITGTDGNGTKKSRNACGLSSLQLLS